MDTQKLEFGEVCLKNGFKSILDQVSLEMEDKYGPNSAQVSHSDIPEAPIYESLVPDIRTQAEPNVYQLVDKAEYDKLKCVNQKLNEEVKDLRNEINWLLTRVDKLE